MFATVRGRAGVPARLPDLLGRVRDLPADRDPPRCGSGWRRTPDGARALAGDRRGGSRAWSGTRSSRRGCSARPASASCTSALFLGSTILLIGNINIVTGGLPEAVLGLAARRRASGRSSSRSRTLTPSRASSPSPTRSARRLVQRPARLAAGHRTGPADPRRSSPLVVGDRVRSRRRSRRRAYGDIPGAFVANALAVPLRAPRAPAPPRRCSWSCGGRTSSCCAAFLVYIPTNKHFHVYTSFVNIWLRKLEPRGQLPAMDLEREDATFGIRTLADLGWKDVLDGFTCTECGRCEAACPAHHTGKPLNPRALIMGIRRMSEAAEAGIDLIPNSPCRAARPTDRRRPPGPGRVSPRPSSATAISYDAVWDCVTCGACVEACPVTIEHVDKIVGLRRNLVLEDSRFPPELTAAFRGMESVANPWGQPPSARLDWTKGLPFHGPHRRRGQGGGRARTGSRSCTGSAARPPSTIATGGSPAPWRPASTPPGSRFAVLGQEEACTGDPARRMGNEYVFQMLATPEHRDAQPLRDRRSGRSSRPARTASTRIGNEYGQLGGSFTIRHHSEYLADLVEPGGSGSAATACRRDDHLPRLLLPGPLQRRDRRAARRPGRHPGRRAARDGQPRPRRRSAAARAAGGCGWRRPAGRGSTPRGRSRCSTRAPRRRHGLPVLHGHAPRRAGRGGSRGRHRRTRSPPRTSASCWRRRSIRSDVPVGRRASPEGRSLPVV